MAIKITLTADELFVVTKWAWVWSHKLIDRDVKRFYQYLPTSIRPAVRSTARQFKKCKQTCTPQEWRELIKLHEMSPECAETLLYYA